MATVILVIHLILALAIILLVMLQRSEGGGLGVGGSSSGFMTARGAADFLTRSTAVLATIFIVLAIALAAIAGVSRKPATIDTSLVNQVGSTAPATAPVVPDQTQRAPANDSAPAVPLQQ